MKNGIVSVLVLPLALVFSTQPVQAAEPLTKTFFISEILPQPTSGSEWVELTNLTSQSVSIESFTLWDEISSPSLLQTLHGTIAANSSLVITLSGSKLNNSSDGVVLKTPSGETYDAFRYPQSNPGLSWTRITLETDQGVETTATPNTWEALTIPPTPIPSPSPTPMPSPTTTPSPSPTPSDIPTFSGTVIISEIMSCGSTTTSEWIELYRPNDTSLDLNGWSLLDASNNTRSLAGQIPAGSFLVQAISPALLNNTGDSIYILDPNGQIHDHATFGPCSSGTSFILRNDIWEKTAVLSPGSATPAILLSANQSEMEQNSNTIADEIDNEQTISPQKKPEIKSEKLLSPDYSSSDTQSENIASFSSRIFRPPIISLTQPPLFIDPQPLPPRPRISLWPWIGGILGGGVFALANALYLYGTYFAFVPLA